MLELFQLPLSKQQRVSSNSRTIAKRNLSLSSFSSLKKKKLPFPRFFHRLLPRHVASPSFVSSSLLPALSPALYVSLCLSPPLDPRVIGVDALEGDSRYGLKRMTKLSKWKGADLVTSSYIFPRLFPIDHRFNSMKNEQVSLSLSLCLVTFQEVNPKGFIFFSFFPVYDDRVFLLDFFPLLLTLQDATSLRTLLFSFLSGYFRTNTVYLVILHAVRVFSINFIVFASLLREGIETLPDYYFVNFVLFTIHGIFGIKFFKNPQIIQFVQFIENQRKNSQHIVSKNIDSKLSIFLSIFRCDTI